MRVVQVKQHCLATTKILLFTSAHVAWGEVDLLLDVNQVTLVLQSVLLVDTITNKRSLEPI